MFNSAVARMPVPVKPLRPVVSGQRADNPLRGIGLVVAAMLCFSCSDVAAKYLNESLPSVEIGWLRYVAFTLLLTPMMAAQGGPAVLRTARPILHIVRGLGMLGSALFFIFALRWLPMADATATGFVSPAFVTALSIPVLGERVGFRRWAAVAVGLAGVLIVVRPGGSTFHLAAVLPILSAMSWAVAVVVTRKLAGADRPATTLVWTALSGLIAVSVLVPFDWTTPDASQIGFGLIIGIMSTLAQWLIVQAYRFADASVLAPFSYTQLIWSLIAGFVVFGALPDRWTLLGATIIVGSGLYTAHRESVRRGQG